MLTGNLYFLLISFPCFFHSMLVSFGWLLRARWQNTLKHRIIIIFLWYFRISDYISSGPLHYHYYFPMISPIPPITYQSLPCPQHSYDYPQLFSYILSHILLSWINFANPFYARFFEISKKITVKLYQFDSSFQMRYFSSIFNPIEIDCL